MNNEQKNNVPRFAGFIVYSLTFIVVIKRASFDKPVLSGPFTLRQAQGER